MEEPIEQPGALEFYSARCIWETDQLKMVASACAKAGIYSPAWFLPVKDLLFIRYLIREEEKTVRRQGKIIAELIEEGG
jgi:hypothetical protein